MPKLTKRFVESIVPDPKKITKYWDEELRRFGVIVMPSGRRTYCIEYRNEDRIQKRIKIGIHGQITAEEARNLAKVKLGQVAHGDDIAEQTKKIRNLPTFSELADDYLKTHGKKKREKSFSEDQRLLKSHILPVLGSLKVANITRRQIEEIHLKMSSSPYQANRIIALLSKIFSIAVSWGVCDENPVKGIQKYQEEKRDRWLSEKELERFWEVLDNHPKSLSVCVFKFLLLTGARKGEALSATWDQFNLEKGVWTKPSHLTKQKKTEHLPLSELTLALLRHVKALSGDSVFVFPGRLPGQPIKELKTIWKTLLKEAKIDNVRIHDLRHTHASHLVSSGLSLSIVGKLLGHTQASTTQRYAHLADAPLRQAVELFSTKVGLKKV